MAQLQLIYISRPFGYDAATLNGILFSARHHNRRNDMTGALVCRDDIFLQLLEGPGDAVTETYSRIRRDKRHIDVSLLWSGDCETRMFPNWDMRHDPVRSWLWTPEEVWAGAPLKCPADDIRAIFARIAAQPHNGETPVL